MGHYRKRTNKIMLTACNALIFRCIWVCLQRPTDFGRQSTTKWAKRKITSDKWSNVIYVRFHATLLEYCANAMPSVESGWANNKIASGQRRRAKEKKSEVEGKCTRKMPLFFIIVLEMLLNEPLEFYDRVIYVRTVLKRVLCNFDKWCIGFGFGGFPRTEIVKWNFHLDQSSFR